jgi:hypothetical protein
LDDVPSAQWEVQSLTYQDYSDVVSLDKGIHKVEIGFNELAGSDYDLIVDFVDVIFITPQPPSAPLLLAFNPEPADGTILADTNVTLSWSSGSGAQLHIVYFGDNFDDMNIDAGGILLETTTYTPGPLELDKVYYWRVDEVEADGTLHKGDVWSFTVADPLAEALDSDSHTLE